MAEKEMIRITMESGETHCFVVSEIKNVVWKQNRYSVEIELLTPAPVDEAQIKDGILPKPLLNTVVFTGSNAKKVWRKLSKQFSGDHI